jgi:hypothetical protein
MQGQVNKPKKLVDNPRFAAEMKDDFHICEK